VEFEKTTSRDRTADYGGLAVSGSLVSSYDPIST
jgi:hypothetical protein